MMNTASVWTKAALHIDDFGACMHNVSYRFDWFDRNTINAWSIEN